ncbi:MAG: hypothetical protein HY928_06655 [Elusimicrobia bacterium]|nr:hypothetical protein [Elusimicrobiota bacterium]
MTTDHRPPTPPSAPGPEQPREPAKAASPEPVADLRHRVGDAVRAAAAATSPGQDRAADQDPRSPAGRLRRLYDVWAMPVGFSLHFKANNVMDLVVEKLQVDRVSLTHYGELNGDLMKDPDVEVLLLPDGTIRGVSFQNDYVGVYHTCEDEPPTSYLSRSINDFLGSWLKELHAQGFATPTPAEAQRRTDALAAFLRDDQ